MRDADERQASRIKLLQFIGHQAGYNPTIFVYSNTILEKNNNLSSEEINRHIFYLNQRGYLEIAPIKSDQSPDRFAWAKITSKGIDFVEKLEQNRSTEEYENDFSKTVILMFKVSFNQVNIGGDMTNSQIQLSSNNSSQTTVINENFINELKQILEEIKKAEPENQNIIKPIEEELKKSKIDWNKMKSFLQTLLGISTIAAQLFTPELRHALGLP